MASAKDPSFTTIHEEKDANLVDSVHHALNLLEQSIIAKDDKSDDIDEGASSKETMRNSQPFQDILKRRKSTTSFTTSFTTNNINTARRLTTTTSKKSTDSECHRHANKIMFSDPATIRQLSTCSTQSISAASSSISSFNHQEQQQHRQNRGDGKKRIKLTLLNLSGIQVRSKSISDTIPCTHPISNASTAIDSNKRSHHNNDRPQLSTIHAHSSRPNRKNDQCLSNNPNFAITASISFTGSCNPNDMRVVSSGFCSQTEQLYVESNPIIVQPFIHSTPCAKQQARKIIPSIARRSTISATSKPTIVNSQNSMNNNSNKKNDSFVATWSENHHSTKQETDLTAFSDNNYSLPHLIVSIQKDEEIHNMHAEKKSSMARVDTDHNIDAQMLSQNSQPMQEQEISIPHLSTSSSSLHISSQYSSSYNSNQSKNSCQEEENIGLDESIHDEGPIQTAFSTSIPMTTVFSTSNTNTNGDNNTSHKNKDETKIHDRQMVIVNTPSHAIIDTAVPEILELNISLNVKQIHDDDQTTDMLNVLSSCNSESEGGGAVAHLVLFSDLISSIATSNDDKEEGYGNREHEQASPRRCRTMRIPVRKKNVPLSRSGMSSISAISAGSCSYQHYHNKNNNGMHKSTPYPKHEPDAWVDLDEDAMVTVQLEEYLDDDSVLDDNNRLSMKHYHPDFYSNICGDDTFTSIDMVHQNHGENSKQINALDRYHVGENECHIGMKITQGMRRNTNDRISDDNQSASQASQCDESLIINDNSVNEEEHSRKKVEGEKPRKTNTLWIESISRVFAGIMANCGEDLDIYGQDQNQSMDSTIQTLF
jgi:hypothetical protein